MVNARYGILVPAIVGAVLATGIAVHNLCAATGDVLVQYHSQLQSTPEQQGWNHVGMCLSDNCPGSAHLPGDPTNYVCYYQGWQDTNADTWPDNSCLLGIGCRKPSEHYNSPDEPNIDGACTYTEWIAFDDANASRPLTILDSTVPGSPPWGAQSFVNAPSYPALRISTGDGNLVANSLPVYASPWPPNDRNQGLAKVRHDLTVPGGVSAVTLMCKVAAGPRSGGHEFIRIRVFGRQFTFGVDGDQTSPTYGRLTYGDDANGNPIGLLFDQTVAVAQPVAAPDGTPLPSSGEFFTLRAILHADGSFYAYLDEELSTYFTGQVAAGVPPWVVDLTPDLDDATMWFDYVQVLEGELNLTCPDPVFDFNRDGYVDQIDVGAFFGCVTGPANASGTWDSLSSECKCMDFNHDQSIDMRDFAGLQRCLTTGGSSPADPNCDDE